MGSCCSRLLLPLEAMGPRADPPKASSCSEADCCLPACLPHCPLPISHAIPIVLAMLNGTLTPNSTEQAPRQVTSDSAHFQSTLLPTPAYLRGGKALEEAWHQNCLHPPARRTCMHLPSPLKWPLQGSTTWCVNINRIFKSPRDIFYPV